MADSRADELALEWEKEIAEFATKDDPYYNGVRQCLDDLRAAFEGDAVRSALPALVEGSTQLQVRDHEMFKLLRVFEPDASSRVPKPAEVIAKIRDLQVAAASAEGREQALKDAIEALAWAERQLSRLVTEDEGHGAFLRGSRMELAGFGSGMSKLRAALRSAQSQEQQR